MVLWAFMTDAWKSLKMAYFTKGKYRETDILLTPDLFETIKSFARIEGDFKFCIILPRYSIRIANDHNQSTFTTTRSNGIY